MVIQIQKIYCIYNAEGTLKGELKYIYDKYINNIKCSMCEITHSAISPKKKWKVKCATYKIKIECLHLDELPKNIKGLVSNKAPCVVGQMNSGIKILIHDKELIKMNGDIDSFFHSLDNKIKIQ
tara:strand:- start:502 stop:873 length:372 start_codon:yes stop_codon:yes gene_type:complete